MFGFCRQVEVHELTRRSTWASDTPGWHVSWLGSVTVFTVLLTLSHAVARWVKKPVGRRPRRFLETARLPLPARARN